MSDDFVKIEKTKLLEAIKSKRQTATKMNDGSLQLDEN